MTLLLGALARQGAACAARWLAAGLAVVLVVGCETVRMEPVALTPAEGAEVVITVESDAAIVFDTGYSRTVRAGTRFALVGSVPQGRVYRPIDSVLTVEGAHMHEAWLVVAGDRLVGFYLPVEKAFAPQAAAVALQIRR